jgi:hypothetical protein
MIMELIHNQKRSENIKKQLDYEIHCFFCYQFTVDINVKTVTNWAASFDFVLQNRTR